MYYVMVILIGMGLGGWVAWMVLSARAQAGLTEQQRLAALEPEVNRLRSENAGRLVDKTRLEQEKLSLEREKSLI